MLFIKLSTDNPNVLVNYCRNCGNEDIPATENLCVFKNNSSKIEYLDQLQSSLQKPKSAYCANCRNTEG